MNARRSLKRHKQAGVSTTAKEIRISGSGGQGVVLAGIILAEAAGIFEDKHVIHVQDYGGAMRGGAVRSEVVIADEEDDIEYPAVLNADILVAMTQAAANKWTASVKEGGIVVYDSTNVTKTPSSAAKTYNVPLTRIAQEKLGTTLVANIVALGVICALTGVVSMDTLSHALVKRVPKGTEELNKKALQVGFEVASRM